MNEILDSDNLRDQYQTALESIDNYEVKIREMEEHIGNLETQIQKGATTPGLFIS